MKLIINQSSVKRLLRWSQGTLFAIAISMLGYTGFVLLDSWKFQHSEGRRLDRLLAERPAAPPGVLAVVATQGLIGRVVIARLGVSVIVAEGVDGRTLRRAAGHIPGTALPGQIGNIGISGHRDTFFRPLRNIRRNDVIAVITPLGDYHYRVLSTSIVSPQQVQVLDPATTEILTLVTCYPFYFVGAAPARFIVRAERIT